MTPEDVISELMALARRCDPESDARDVALAAWRMAREEAAMIRTQAAGLYVVATLPGFAATRELDSAKWMRENDPIVHTQIRLPT